MSFVGSAAAASYYVTAYTTKGEKGNYNKNLRKASKEAVKTGKGKSVKQVLFTIARYLRGSRSTLSTKYRKAR